MSQSQFTEEARQGAEEALGRVLKRRHPEATFMGLREPQPSQKESQVNEAGLPREAVHKIEQRFIAILNERHPGVTWRIKRDDE